MNAVVRGLRSAGLPLVSLDEESLLARASRNTGGLIDFGDAAFRDPLRRLLRSLEDEAGLTALGRLIARRDVLRLLENRLRMTAERRCHPEMDRGEIRRPLFITGLPRTGSTFLHGLLAATLLLALAMILWSRGSAVRPPATAAKARTPGS